MSGDINSLPILKHVTIYTDGAAVPNPGAGGYGVVLRFGDYSKELSGGFQRTTNNRMEMMAIIVGLEVLKGRCKVTLHSDSQYIVNAVNTGSVFRWRDNNWTINRGGTKTAKNVDLWKRLLAAYEQHEVEMVWVKGHAGVPDNERCDELAMAACRQSDLPLDAGFTESQTAESETEGEMIESVPKLKGKITCEGQPCRKCGTPVEKRIPRKRKQTAYYFEWYLYCPKCDTMYMVDAAKRQNVSEGGEPS